MPKKPPLEPSIPFRERVGCTVSEGRTVSGLGNTMLYELIGDGTLESIKVGRRRIILVRSLLRLIEGDKAFAADRESQPERLNSPSTTSITMSHGDGPTRPSTLSNDGNTGPTSASSTPAAGAQPGGLLARKP